MPPYKNLKAWEHAQRLAIECVKASRAFPEIDRAAWFTIPAARAKILRGQLPLIDEFAREHLRAG